MVAATVSPAQRHTRNNPCRVCGGYVELQQGKGRRCAGFDSRDGRYCHCTREEHGGDMQPTNAAVPTYPHFMEGPCRCGKTHGPAPIRAEAPRKQSAHQHQPGVTRRYELRDPDGTLAGVHVRIDRADGSKKLWWEQHKGRGAAEMPVYGLLAHLAAPADALRILCEGEKATDAVNAAVRRAGRTDVIAVGTVTGAPALPCDASLQPLVGFHVATWADNDDVGRLQMKGIAQRLTRLHAQVPKWIDWRDAPAKGDAFDYFAASGTVEGMLAMVTERPTKQSTEQPYMPTPAIDAHAENKASMGMYDAEGHLWKGFVLLSGVQPEQVRWLWQGRIPLGKLTVVDGDPGLGKSLVFGADIAARITVGGAMPDGTPGLAAPAGVVLLSVEDEPADTHVPRLLAAGADTSRVLAIRSVPRFRTRDDGSLEAEEGSFCIPRDLPARREAIAHVSARYVLIDPLMEYLAPGETNSYRDQDVRTALAPLARLAAETGAAIVAIRHLNKSTAANPLYRGGGFIGIIGAARSAMLVAADPDDPNQLRRILARTKSNLAAPVPSLAYHIEVSSSDVPFIVWDGATEHTAAQLLTLPTDPESRSMTDDAVEWLRAELADGPRAASDIQSAAKASGLDISPKALRRARERLNVKLDREGFGPGSRVMWSLPRVTIIDALPSHTCPSETEGRYEDGGQVCTATGGAHVYAMMRTADGRRVCIECDEPEMGRAS